MELPASQLMPPSLAGRSKAHMRTPLAVAAWVKAVLAGDKCTQASAPVQGLGRRSCNHWLLNSVLAQSCACWARVGSRARLAVRARR